MKFPIYSASFLALILAPAYASAQSTLANEPQVVGGFTAFGEYLGDSGIVASNAPGLNEIFLAGVTDGSSWRAQRHDPGSGTYVQSYASSIYPSEIRFMDLIDVHPSSGDELMLLLDNGDLYLYQQSSKLELAVVSTGVDQVTAFGHYDLDHDGTEEFVLIGTGGLYIFNSRGAVLANFPDLNGTDLAIGQMDADPGLEIAVTDGSILDLATGLIQCTWSTGFGFDIELSDFDQDGMQELIIAEEFNLIWTFDVDTCLPKWSIPRFNTSSILVADSDSDGVSELIIGDAQWGDLTSLDLATRTVNWKIDNPGHSVLALLVADVNQDGTKEVVWTSYGAPNMFVGNFSTESVDWSNHDLEGPFLGPVFGDVDGDGVDEIVLASTRSDAHRPGRIVVLEQNSLVPHISETSRKADSYLDIELYDVDGDGDQEILLASQDVGDGLIEIYDYSVDGTFTLIWSNNIKVNGSYFLAVDAADLDGDGTVEIIGGSGKVTSISEGNRVYVYDFATGDELWHSIQMGAYPEQVTDLAIADFDGDGELEIAGLIDTSDVYVYAADSTLESIIRGEFKSLRTGPMVSGLRNTLLLGDTTGTVQAHRWSGSSYQIVASAGLATQAIDGFTLWGNDRILAGVSGSLGIFDLPTGTSIWQSANYGPKFGSKVQLLDNGDFVTVGFSGLYTLGLR
jgi:VCBS repeat protein